jgi:hypothetical protein
LIPSFVIAGKLRSAASLDASVDLPLAGGPVTITMGVPMRP